MLPGSVVDYGGINPFFLNATRMLCLEANYTLSTACHIVGWIFVVHVVIAGVTAVVTASAWQEAVTGPEGGSGRSSGASCWCPRDS